MKMVKARKEFTVETKENIISLIDHGLKVGQVSKLLQLNRSTIGLGKSTNVIEETGLVENRS